MRRAARAFIRTRLPLSIERDSVKLHSVIYEAKAELLGDALLKRLELVVYELDDVPGLDVD